MAGNEVTGLHFAKFGHRFCTFVASLGTTCTERTTAGHMKRAGNIAFKVDTLVSTGDLGIRYGNCREKGNGVRMDGLVINFVVEICLTTRRS